MKKLRLLSLLVVPCASMAIIAGCNSGGGAADNSAPVAPDNSASSNNSAPAGNAAPADNSAPADNAAASNTASTDTSAPGKTHHFAFITNNVSDYWTVAHAGVDKADKELPNVDVEFKMPANGTPAEQTQLVNDLLSKGVDGIAISPVDPTNQTPLIDKTSEKALVFTQDSDAAKSKRACYIGTDNVAAGHMAGQLIKKALPNGGKIMMFVGNKDAQNAADRAKGITDELKGSKIQIVDIRTDETDRARAKSNVSTALVKTPDLAGLVGLWSYNGPAILSAVKDAGKVGKVKIVCFDDEADTISGIQSGAIDSTVVQQPFVFGYQSIINMNKYLNGDKSVIPASKVINIPTVAITKATVDAYKKAQDKLLGKG